jgi:hypothetical protein
MLRVHEVTEQLLDRQTFNDFFDPEIFLSSLFGARSSNQVYLSRHVIPRSRCRISRYRKPTQSVDLLAVEFCRTQEKNQYY